MRPQCGGIESAGEGTPRDSLHVCRRKGSGGSVLRHRGCVNTHVAQTKQRIRHPCSHRMGPVAPESVQELRNICRDLAFPLLVVVCQELCRL